MISFATTIALTVIALLMLGLAIRRFTQRKLVSGGFSLISALAIGLAAFLQQTWRSSELLLSIIELR
jgi:Co/Zn/Cd efflux system component